MRKSYQAAGFTTQAKAGVLAVALAFGITPAIAYAGETAEEATDSLLLQIAESMDSDSTYAYDYLEDQSGTSSEGDLTTLSADLPSILDLRERGVVTPVKFQNPWGTCWAFGITAAAETSILSELGLTYQQAAAYEEGTLENAASDLSEHHLSWFAKNHLTSGSQKNEGCWYSSAETTADVNASMNGGMPYFGAFAYASGMGVVDESTAPYNGMKYWVQVKKGTTRTDLNMTYQEALEAGYQESEIRCYSRTDDWSLDESLRFTQVCALEESNILPSVTPEYDSDTKTYTLNEDGVNAIKAELNAGRAVNIGYLADASDPNKEASALTTRYLNVASNGDWAQFTWSADGGKLGLNHSVTIVGYDDTYSRYNFQQSVNPAKWDDNGNVIYQLADGTQLKNDKDGNPLDPTTGAILDKSKLEVARETTNLTLPSGDGAWIVKNSWGSSSESFPNSNGGTGWGTNGSGYFYLSYYDMSIGYAESFDFAVTEAEQSEYDYSLCYEYDFLPTETTMANTTYSEASMANVYESDEASKVCNLSCQTTYPNTHVKYQLYLLKDGAENPTDGTLAATVEETYTYGGYHRVTLSSPVFMDAGQTFSVVITEMVGDEEDGIYSLNFNRATGELGAIAKQSKDWATGVINEGESYLGVKGDDGSIKWSDWSGFIKDLQAVNIGSASCYSYDNFCIKAYATPVGDFPEILGDINNNGVLNIVDVQLVYDLATNTYGEDYADFPYTDSWTAGGVKLAADFNGDGVVDATDAWAIQNYVMNPAAA